MRWIERRAVEMWLTTGPPLAVIVVPMDESWASWTLYDEFGDAYDNGSSSDLESAKREIVEVLLNDGWTKEELEGGDA